MRLRIKVLLKMLLYSEQICNYSSVLLPQLVSAQPKGTSTAGSPDTGRGHPQLLNRWLYSAPTLWLLQSLGRQAENPCIKYLRTELFVVQVSGVCMDDHLNIPHLRTLDFDFLVRTVNLQELLSAQMPIRGQR